MQLQAIPPVPVQPPPQQFPISESNSSANSGGTGYASPLRLLDDPDYDPAADGGAGAFGPGNGNGAAIGDTAAAARSSELLTSTAASLLASLHEMAQREPATACEVTAIIKFLPADGVPHTRSNALVLARELSRLALLRNSHAFMHYALTIGNRWQLSVSDVMAAMSESAENELPPKSFAERVGTSEGYLLLRRIMPATDCRIVVLANERFLTSLLSYEEIDRAFAANQADMCSYFVHREDTQKILFSRAEQIEGVRVFDRNQQAYVPCLVRFHMAVTRSLYRWVAAEFIPMHTPTTKMEEPCFVANASSPPVMAGGFAEAQPVHPSLIVA